jgi:hypothetical protein
MVFNMSSWIINVFVVLTLWSAFLTYLVVRLVRHYDRLVKTTSKNTLKEILEALIHEDKVLTENQKKLEKQLAVLEHDTKYHIQQVGLVRFNPFSDTGGSQSFTVAFLDSKDNGIVMTSLYARTGNRWYVKHVTGGKGEGIELSKEEQTAITKAKHFTEEIRK